LVNGFCTSIASDVLTLTELVLGIKEISEGRFEATRAHALPQVDDVGFTNALAPVDKQAARRKL
jgi:hypothetical protein